MEEHVVRVVYWLTILINYPALSTTTRGSSYNYSQELISSPRPASSGLLWGELEDGVVGEELRYLYEQHERFFVHLMLLQLVIEVLFLLSYAINHQAGLAELDLVYGPGRHDAMKKLLVFGFVGQAVYGGMYYWLAYCCVAEHRGSDFRRFLEKSSCKKPVPSQKGLVFLQDGCMWGGLLCSRVCLMIPNRNRENRTPWFPDSSRSHLEVLRK